MSPPPYSPEHPRGTPGRTTSQMSPVTAALLLPLFALLCLFLNLRKQKNGRPLPPGPPGLPIIGNLHMMGQLPHRTLRRMAQKYGPIMSLRLGQVPAVVVSSPEAAELFLKTHDLAFAGRPKTEIAKHFHYGYKGLILTEYGPSWRNLRRLCTVKLLNPAKIDSFAGKRRREVESMVASIRAAAEAREAVDVSLKVAETVESMVCQMMIGRSADGRYKLKEAFQEGTQLAGVFNIGEFVPVLLPFDLQGVSRAIKAASQRLDKIWDLIIDERIKLREGRKAEQEEDFMDVLLSLANTSAGDQHTDVNDGGDPPSNPIERDDIKAILLDMLAAAMDTSASTIEWAVSEIFRHPDVMRKLQDEMSSVVGLGRTVAEEDLAKLPYLEMVVKEGMRLHPAVPLLLPHESMEETTINGYRIPNKSRIIVNAWAIMRDTNAWPDRPEEFVPERFENSSVEAVGRDFQLIPFGSGRRGCAGIKLGLTFVRLVVAQLVHCFDWELAGNTSPGELDLDEKFGFALHRTNHLRALPSYRLEAYVFFFH